MELYSSVTLVIEKNDKKFSFVMPVGANWGESYDACFECLLKVVELSKQAAEAMQQKPAEETVNTGA
jgi:hypothetical protein